MKTEKQIDEHYDALLDFYCDNRTLTFDQMVFYRKLLERATPFIENSKGNPEADDLLEIIHKIQKCEDENG